MSQKVDYQINLEGKLTIVYVQEMKLILIEVLNNGNCLELNVADLEEIDISGLQLLISFAREASLMGKEFLFTGVFTEKFREDLNSISFLQGEMVNGEDLTQFIKEII